MIRFYFVPVLSLCLFLNACSNPTSSDTDNPQTKLSDDFQANSEQTTKTIKSALNKAQSATEKASNNVQSALEKVNKTTQSASKVVEDVETIKTQLSAMSTKADRALTAVHSGNVKMAQQEFAQLKENWGKIKTLIKKSSPKTYQEINTHLSNTENLFKQPNPDSTKLAQQLSLFSNSHLTLLESLMTK